MRRTLEQPELPSAYVSMLAKDGHSNPPAFLYSKCSGAIDLQRERRHVLRDSVTPERHVQVARQEPTR